MIFEMDRVYTKKLILLIVSPKMMRSNILGMEISLISIHLIMNPANGGSPARFAITSSRVHFSFLVFGDELIFFCFDLFKNNTTSRTAFQ